MNSTHLTHIFCSSITVRFPIQSFHRPIARGIAHTDIQMTRSTLLFLPGPKLYQIRLENGSVHYTGLQGIGLVPKAVPFRPPPESKMILAPLKIDGFQRICLFHRFLRSCRYDQARYVRRNWTIKIQPANRSLPLPTQIVPIYDYEALNDAVNKAQTLKAFTSWQRVCMQCRLMPSQSSDDQMITAVTATAPTHRIISILLAVCFLIIRRPVYLRVASLTSGRVVAVEKRLIARFALAYTTFLIRI